MTNPEIENLKNSINREHLFKFNLKDLKDGLFMPLNYQDGFLYVGLVNSNDIEKRKNALNKVITITKLKPKITNITEDDFNELIKVYENEVEQEFIISADEMRLFFEPQTLIKDDSINEEPVQKKEEINLLDEIIPIKPLSTENINLTPLDEINIDKIVDTSQLEEPQTHKYKKKLGERLIENGYVTQEQINEALAESKVTNIPFGSILVNMGYLPLEKLRETLSEQLGIPHAKPEDLQISPDVISLLPEDFIKENECIPIKADAKTVVVAMVHPDNAQILNEIIYLTGLKPTPLILTHNDYEEFIGTFFKTKKELEKLVESIDVEDKEVKDEDNLWDLVEKELNSDSNSIAKLANSIITEAIDKKASDIHIEPRMNNYHVRYRIDGILIKTLEIPNSVESALISRLKVMARMNIAEKRRSQDGHLNIKHNNITFDLRVNTLPVGSREKMVIRILQPDLKVTSSDKRIQLIGATKQDIQKLNLLTSSPHGIILATGPTGSGKTTTLYSVLNKLNNETVNIVTIEDPVEVKLEGINQVQVNPKADITFASSMRSILRQDPDIIMVGEIRDFETLDAAINAALTGHLVLSTIHTNSATATITRLLEMGAADHLIATTIVGIIAQRLVRKLCPKCKESLVPLVDDLKLIIPRNEDIENFAGIPIYKPKGCSYCNNTGYVGRIGLYEIMPINREIRKLISQSASSIEIEEFAISCGMKTLQRAGLDAIYNGETSIDEYLRVIGINNN